MMQQCAQQAVVQAAFFMRESRPALRGFANLSGAGRSIVSSYATCCGQELGPQSAIFEICVAVQVSALTKPAVIGFVKAACIWFTALVDCVAYARRLLLLVVYGNNLHFKRPCRHSTMLFHSAVAAAGMSSKPLSMGHPLNG
jgi:hypothetical protein